MPAHPHPLPAATGPSLRTMRRRLGALIDVAGLALLVVHVWPGA